MKYVKLCEVADLLSGFAFKSKNYVETGIRIIRIANVQDGFITDEHPCFYPDKTIDDISKYLLNDGDLLVSLTGNVGRIGILKKEFLPAALNQRVCCIRIKRGIQLEIKYLYYYLLRKQFVRDCIKASKGVAQLNLSTRWLENYPIPFPDLDTQNEIIIKIEESLSQLDSAVATLNKTKQQLEIYRQAVIKEAFDRVSLDDYNSLKTVIVGTLQNGLYKPKSDYGTGTCILRIDGFYDGRILDDYDYKRVRLDDNELEKYSLQVNDLVINRVNSMQYLGKCALVRTLAENTIFESNMMRIKLNPSLVDYEYIIYYLSSVQGKKELTKNAKQAVNQASINQTDVCNTIVPLPDVSVQRELRNSIDIALSIYKDIGSAIHQSLQQAEALRQSILKQAFPT